MMMQHSYLLEQLLGGAFICEVTDSEAFRHLQTSRRARPLISTCARLIGAWPAIQRAQCGF